MNFKRLLFNFLRKIFRLSDYGKKFVLTNSVTWAKNEYYTQRNLEYLKLPDLKRLVIYGLKSCTKIELNILFLFPFMYITYVNSPVVYISLSALNSNKLGIELQE